MRGAGSHERRRARSRPRLGRRVLSLPAAPRLGQAAVMPSTSTTAMPRTPEAIAALADSHGLSIQPDSVRLNEAGLDYLVAYARSSDGQDWVLRIPRRDDMADSVRTEASVLEVVSTHLQDVAVPQWQIAEDDLIAYPLLPGSPAMTIDDGVPTFHVDVASATYATELGRLLAALHAIPTEDFQEAGLVPLSVAEVREQHRRDLAEIAAAFPVAGHLRQRWEAWLGDDSYWPMRTTFTHGEPYHAHVLVDTNQHITGVLDWTTGSLIAAVVQSNTPVIRTSTSPGCWTGPPRRSATRPPTLPSST